MSPNKTKRESDVSARDSRGRYLPGHPGGPGRRKGYTGKLDFMAEAKRWAEREGRTIEEVGSEVAGAVVRKALDGDIAAMRLACDRLFGVLPKDPLIDARLIHCDAQHNNGSGPPIPPPEVLASHLEKLAHVAEGVRVRVLERESSSTSNDGAQQAHGPQELSDLLA